MRSALHCGARVQRLALLTTLMLARERLPPTAAADVFVGLASAVAVLPSGLLAMVGGAITLLDSQLEVRPVSEQSTAEYGCNGLRSGRWLVPLAHWAHLIAVSCW